MKNLINYYYDLNVSDIRKNGDKYKFIIDDKVYTLEPFYDDINRIVNIYIYNISNGIYCHDIVFNKEGNPTTFYNNINYILLRRNVDIRQHININDIVSYNVPIYIEKKFNWDELWCKKIDYYEYQINQFGKKFPLIRESFSYYDGMIETAIMLINTIDKNNLRFYLNHNRINLSESLDEFYNPINLTIDVKVRDICEYFKQMFFFENFKYDEFEYYIYHVKLTNEEAVLFLSRMLFPSYYFDVYDNIIQGTKEEKEIKKIIKKTEEYENFLYNLYYIMKQLYQIPEIEWLKKM